MRDGGLGDCRGFLRLKNELREGRERSEKHLQTY